MLLLAHGYNVTVVTSQMALAHILLTGIKNKYVSGHIFNLPYNHNFFVCYLNKSYRKVRNIKIYVLCIELMPENSNCHLP